MVYNKVTQLHVYIYISLSFWSSLPPFHPSGSPQSTELSSLCYTTGFHELSILHMVVYLCQFQFSNSSPTSVHPSSRHLHPSLSIHQHIIVAHLLLWKHKHLVHSTYLRIFLLLCLIGYDPLHWPQNDARILQCNVKYPTTHSSKSHTAFYS